MVTAPGAAPVTAPVRATVAVPRLEDDHAHWRVTSRTVPSWNVPVAVSWIAARTPTENGFGVTATLESFVFVTRSEVDPVTPESVAVSSTGVALQATPVASPLVPAAFEIVATAGFDDAQVTSSVTFRVDVSE